MGVNNKQRRAAKAKKRRQAAARHGASAGPVHDVWLDPPDLDQMAADFVIEAIERVGADPAFAAELARRLLLPGTPLPRAQALAHLGRIQTELVAGAVRHGWGPNDLVQMVTRQLDAEHVPHVVALTTEVTRRFPAAQIPQQWADELAAAGPARAAELGSVAGLTVAFGLAGLLSGLMPLPPTQDRPGAVRTSRATQDPTEAKLLARVRALLSKAESTEFPEEAEALSAKAQELISRHSLDRLMAAPAQDDPEEIGAMRLWIDAPYVVPKAQLIQAVAHANRCRAIVAEKPGFSTLMGLRRDLQAVELLVTSLLVQASSAMVAHGRQVDRTGTSRTKSFRQSFLISYAHRIGERLDEATFAAVQETERSSELVTVLADHGERVDAAMHEAFPQTTYREAGISNYQGWQAGREAADRARLDPRERLTG